MQTITLNKIKLLVGLGNPGRDYDHTRHNVGFMFLDFLAGRFEMGEFREELKFKAEISKCIFNSQTIIFAKPTTFMNLSGEAVQLISNFYRIQPEEILIVHDDLDIKLGEFKIQTGKGPHAHNGINSIENLLANKDFGRIRIGVESRDEEMRSKIAGRDFVLGKFGEDEMKIVNDVFARIKDEIV